MSERMLGFAMATSHVVTKMNTATAVLRALSLIFVPRGSTVERTMPTAPSAAPM